MAFLGQTYEVKDLPEQSGFDPIPAGWYTARITEAEVKTTKAGNGSYLNIRYDIIGPSFEGRVIYGKINLTNPNQQAEQIGMQQLGGLTRAIGLTKLEYSEELLNAEVQIKVSVKKDKTGEYDDSNDVKAFKPVDNKMPMSAPSAAPQTGKATTPPWIKK